MKICFRIEPGRTRKAGNRWKLASKRFPAFIGLWGESPSSDEPPKVDRRMARREPVLKGDSAWIKPAVAGIYSRIQQAPPFDLWGESPASGEPPEVDRRMAWRAPVSKRFPAFIGLWGESPASGEPPKVDRRMARRELVSEIFPKSA